MKTDSLTYYNSFTYRIEKKLSVEDHIKLKDYAKEGIYIYIIHDNIDNNRFFYLTSEYLEENTIINPETFKLKSIPGNRESIHLKFKTSLFGIKFFRITKQKGDFNIIFNDIVYNTDKNNNFFKKYKTHNKKIALNNPDWYLEYILNKNCKSHKKQTLKLLLCKNKYNNQILSHTISTLFILNNCDYQKFNDHSIVLDEGKTGKSSLISYMGSKVDNVSIAGLYGSSDSVRGKFKGGLVTRTKKAILIDETNELINNNKGEKVLSVLNSILENGTYKYIKQFSGNIKSSSQFFFMGNISDNFNLPLFLMGGFGNIETLGRRIGIITYNNNLNGFSKGLIREDKINPYLNAVSLYLSNLFNTILCNKKFIIKLYNHKDYKKLTNYYYIKTKEIYNLIECNITKTFIKSNGTSIDRIITRSLKLWLFDNLDNFINGTKKYNNHSIYEILQYTKTQIDLNLINLQNIKEHIENFNITDKRIEFNKLDYNNLNKTTQQIIKAFYDNLDIITIKGIKYEDLTNKGFLKFVIQNFKRCGISQKLLNNLQFYGTNITNVNGSIVFKVINKNVFNAKTYGVFYDPVKKNVKDDLDLGDLN